MANRSLETVINEIKLLYIENKNTNEPVPLEKKFQNYKKCNLLVNEADTMIESMIRDIQSLELETASPEQTNCIDSCLEMLKYKLNVKETVDIVQQLKATLAGLPSRAEIVDNLNLDTVYEITDVTDVFDVPDQD